MVAVTPHPVRGGHDTARIYARQEALRIYTITIKHKTRSEYGSVAKIHSNYRLQVHHCHWPYYIIDYTNLDATKEKIQNTKVVTKGGKMLTSWQKDVP